MSYHIEQYSSSSVPLKERSEFMDSDHLAGFDVIYEDYNQEDDDEYHNRL